MWEIGEPQEKEVPRPGTRAEQAGCALICAQCQMLREILFELKEASRTLG